MTTLPTAAAMCNTITYLPVGDSYVRSSFNQQLPVVRETSAFRNANTSGDKAIVRLHADSRAKPQQRYRLDPISVFNGVAA